MNKKYGPGPSTEPGMDLTQFLLLPTLSKRDKNMNNSASGIFKVYAAEKDGYNACLGYVKNCIYCNEKIEILDHKVLDFHAGSLHRCRERA